MTAITLITGGAGSGKSRYACERAAQCGENVLFVATCIPCDDEMRAKVARHRAERPSTWHTVEGTREIATVLTSEYDLAIIDCLTLLISQMLVDGVSDIVGRKRVLRRRVAALECFTGDVGGSTGSPAKRAQIAGGDVAI